MESVFNISLSVGESKSESVSEEAKMELPGLIIYEPNWIANSKALFYRTPKNKVLSGPLPVTNWSIPGVLLCGGYLEYDSEVAVLVRLGITRFWCLCSEYGIPDKRHRNYAYGDKLPVGQFNHVKIDDMGITDDAIVLENCNRIVAQIRAGEKIYLHCSGGHGRTGTFLAIILNKMFRKCDRVSGSTYSAPPKGEHGEKLYPYLTLDQILNYIQYSHDQRAANYFGPYYFTKSFLDGDEADIIHAKNFTSGQVPSPQAREQLQQIRRLFT